MESKTPSEDIYIRIREHTRNFKDILNTFKNKHVTIYLVKCLDISLLVSGVYIDEKAILMLTSYLELQSSGGYISDEELLDKKNIKTIY